LGIIVAMVIVLKVMTDIMGTPVRLQKGRSVRIRALSMRVVINPRQRETTILGTSGITHAVAKMLVNIPLLLASQDIVAMESMLAPAWKIIPLKLERNLA
jgi:hypothetical protein